MAVRRGNGAARRKYGKKAIIKRGRKFTKFGKWAPKGMGASFKRKPSGSYKPAWGRPAGRYRK
jgi:hypothetical protein